MNKTNSTSHISAVIISAVAAIIGLSAGFSAASAYTQGAGGISPTDGLLADNQVKQEKVVHPDRDLHAKSTKTTPETPGVESKLSFWPLILARPALSKLGRVSENIDYLTPKQLHKQAQKRAREADGDTPKLTATDKREILWLARIIYSETKRAEEQRLVAWVVRNRVDTGYTGRTYRAVANHASQFSGLHPSDPRYEHNMSRYWASQGDSWRTALKIAKEVYFAPESERPFSEATRHFYSPKSLYGKPDWARGRRAVRVIHSGSHREPRFAFYARVR